jgi:hypothetical protein
MLPVCRLAIYYLRDVHPYEPDHKPIHRNQINFLLNIND